MLTAVRTLTPVGGGGGVVVPDTGPWDVVWTSVVGCSVAGNSLTKTAAGNAWDTAGAISTRSLASGDGWVESTITEVTYFKIFGPSNGNPDNDYNTIDFGCYLRANQAIIYQNGSQVYTGAIPSVVITDVFRVEITSGVVTYKRNGTTFYTSGAAPTYPVIVDAALYHNGAVLSNVVVGGGAWA